MKSGATLGKFLSDDLLEQNLKLHQSNEGYGGGGYKHAKTVNHLVRKYNCRSVLDFGCGEGTLKDYVTKPVVEYDPAVLSKANNLFPCDLVVCTDVLEHVEPEYLSNVLEALRLFRKVRCYVSIATRPSNKILPDGRNAHLIVHGEKFWYKELSKVFYNIYRLEPLRYGECRFVLS